MIALTREFWRRQAGIRIQKSTGIQTRRRVLFTVVRASGLILSAVCLAVPAAAQDVATTFEELRFKVKAGDTVYVTGEDGQEREAKIVGLSASSPVVTMGGAQSNLTEGRVKQMRQRLPDPLRNGALIGFLVGGAGSTAMAKALESPVGSCTGGCVAANILYGGGVGALIGLGIDHLIKGKKTIYEPSQSAGTIVLQPVLLSRTLGFGVGLRF